MHNTKYAGHRAGRAATSTLVATHPASKAPRKALEGATKSVGHALRALGGCPATYFTVEYVVFETEEGFAIVGDGIGCRPDAARGGACPAYLRRGLRRPTGVILFAAAARGPASRRRPSRRSLSCVESTAWLLMWRKRRGPVVALVDSLASGVIGACVEGLTLRDALQLSLDFLKFIRTKLDASHLIHREARPEDRDVEFVRFALERILKEEESKNSYKPLPYHGFGGGGSSSGNENAFRPGPGTSTAVKFQKRRDGSGCHTARRRPRRVGHRSSRPPPRPLKIRSQGPAPPSKRRRASQPARSTALFAGFASNPQTSWR